VSARWDFGGYWTSVLGVQDAAGVVRESGLVPSDRRGLDEWLGTAEAESWRVGGLGGDLPEEWSDHHAKALDMLAAVEVE